MRTVHKRISSLERRIAFYEKRLQITFSIRLWSGLGYFAALVLSVYFNWMWVELLVTLLFLTIFIPYLRLSQKTKNLILDLKTADLFYRRQRDRYEKSFQTSWCYSRQTQSALESDLHLSGNRSIFNLINECFTHEAQEDFFQSLLNGESDLNLVLQKQNLVRSLAVSTGAIRHFFIRGQKHGVLKTFSYLQFTKEALTPPSFTKRATLIFAIWILSIITSAISYYTNSHFVSGVVYAAYILVSLSLLREAKDAFAKGLSINESTSSLVPILKESEKLSELSCFQTLLSKTKQYPVSIHLRKIESILAYLNIESNPLVFTIVNAIFPWNIFWTTRLEKLRQKLALHLQDNMQELYRLENIGSLVMMYSYQTQCFPEFSKDEWMFEELRHPLIPIKNVVANSFTKKANDKVYVITGSNMSGKSTFIRSIGVNQVLALMGAPVYAKKMKTQFIPVMSCIQVSDSLPDGFSYFYAEVVRLKNILENCQKRKCLFLIDEIFKGTNNRERLIGSRALIEALLKTSSFGFVTTHDLDLTAMAESLSGIENYHFRDDVDQGRMVFHYNIHSGPCPTTNALKIMAAEGLPIQV